MTKQTREESEKRRSEKNKKKKAKKKETAGAPKGRKVTNHYVFSMVGGCGRGQKVSWLKRRVRSHLAK